jgi:hypothetical protein
MPLSDNPKDFRSNVGELVRSGRPVKQAVAIAYSHLRELRKKKRKSQ